MAACVCFPCSLPGWQCCVPCCKVLVWCARLWGHGSGAPTMACATGTCCPYLAVGAQPRACWQGTVPTLVLGQVLTALLMGPHQKAVRVRLENKHSDFFKRKKPQQSSFFFLLFVGVSLSLFLLNHEMTHTSELKINPITAAVGSW